MRLEGDKENKPPRAVCPRGSVGSGAAMDAPEGAGAQDGGGGCRTPFLWLSSGLSQTLPGPGRGFRGRRNGPFFSLIDTEVSRSIHPHR